MKKFYDDSRSATDQDVLRVAGRISDHMPLIVTANIA
jgi:hypothetical protein